ncbi:hypothetical protein [Tissierella carlieri]
MVTEWQNRPIQSIHLFVFIDTRYVEINKL